MDDATPLTRTQASQAVGDLGWRLLLGELVTVVRTPSPMDAARVAARLVAAAGPRAADHLRLDLRGSEVVVRVASFQVGQVTRQDADLAAALTREVAQAGATTLTTSTVGRSVQSLEIAVDALDIPSVQPFWRAVTGYLPDPASGEPYPALVDPLGQGPAIWFQQMDAPRPQRNRIHLDLTVPHDEVAARIDAALAAGGVLVSRAEAPAFWILADAEGNEVCLCTWQGRDER
jgi:4a-hydroxytetrahydrobiopterin dehydratase